MKITSARRMSKRDKAFHDREWKKTNIEHYGRHTNWDEELIYLKATEKSKTIGILEFTIQAGVAWVKDLIVANSHRKQGVGKKLMLEVEKIAKERKAHKIFLNTGIGWEAEKFYEQLGYDKTGKLVNHHHHQDHIIFSKFV